MPTHIRHIVTLAIWTTLEGEVLSRQDQFWASQDPERAPRLRTTVTPLVIKTLRGRRVGGILEAITAWYSHPEYEEARQAALATLPVDISNPGVLISDRVMDDEELQELLAE